MAEIHLEKRKKHNLGWLWLLVGLAVIAGLIAWFAMEQDDAELEETAEVTGVEEAEQTAEPTAEQTEQQAQAGAEAGIPVAAILENPNDWEGRTVSGEIAVGSVPTDRGFFIEEDGQRLFVVLDPRNLETPYEVEQENWVNIERATVHGAGSRDRVPGPLSEETQSILEQQEVFLVADGPNVQIAQR